MHESMIWLHGHRSPLGVFADSLTFLGGLILARDAFLRLQDLKSHRLNERFLSEFPDLNLTDDEWTAAIRSLRWTLGGFVLMLSGFLAQLVLRLME